MSTVRTTNIANASSATTNLVLDAFGNVTVGGVIDGLSTPAVATGTGSSSGGTLAAATYYVRIVAFDSAGNTTDAGPESTGVTTTGSTSSIAYTWAAITGATGYRVYFSTTSGTYTSYFVTTSASYTLTTTSGGISAGLPASNTTGISLMPNQSFMRNRIINGDMRIDQRNNGAAVTSGYPVDRWRQDAATSAVFSYQQNRNSVTPPAGFTNYLGAQVTTAYTPGVNTTVLLAQLIEGFNVADLAWGSTNARTATLSFWVQSSLTGTHSGAFVNGAGDRSYVYSYTINSANTWEYKTITVAGDTTGTWLTNNGTGINIRFNLGTGTGTYGTTTANTWQAGNFVGLTNAVQVSATNGATFYITGVQLEVGSVATPFERRQYGTELSLCQRYCYVPAIDSGTGNSWLTIAGGWAGVTCLAAGAFPVRMRTQPVLTTQTATLSNYAIYTPSTGAYTPLTALTLNTVTTSNVFLLNAVVASGPTAGQVGWLVCNSTPNFSLIFSAEL